MKIARKISLVVCFAALAATMFVLAGCNSGGDGAKNNAAGATEQQGKKYLIATDTTFAPFEFLDAQGNYTGIDIDILAAIAADQGFAYEVQPLGFDAALQAVTSAQADGVIAGMSITDERKKIFDFSEPYFDSGVVMGINAKDDTIKKYEDLKGKTVAVKNGTEGEKFAKSMSDKYGFKLTNFKDSTMMYEDVKSGNSAACFEDYPVLGYAIAQGIGLKIVTDMERGSSYGFAVKQGNNSELLSMFDKGLTNIKATGKYQEIIDTYIKK